MSSTPFLVISMGVSGSGKSTLADLLSKHFGCILLEADDFHSAENIAYMATGKPLTDAMREPWIAHMCSVVKDTLAQGGTCILAYSGLRKAHRQLFRELGYPVMFLHLIGDKEVILERLYARANHYMPPDLLDSQFAALEPTDQEADVTQISLAQPIAAIVEQATKLVRQFGSPSWTAGSLHHGRDLRRWSCWQTPDTPEGRTTSSGRNVRSTASR